LLSNTAINSFGGEIFFAAQLPVDFFQCPPPSDAENFDGRFLSYDFCNVQAGNHNQSSEKMNIQTSGFCVICAASPALTFVEQTLRKEVSDKIRGVVV
jgi:hypothetical protein